jgi:hypothetical protein
LIDGEHPNKEQTGMSIDPKYLDERGNIKPYGTYGDLKHDVRPVRMEDARPHWFKPDGTLKTRQETDAEAARAKLAADMVAAQVRARTQKTLSEDEKTLAAFDATIAERSREARYLSRPADKGNALEYIDHLKGKRADVANKIAEEKRIDKLASNRSLQLARTYAETYSRSPPPGADPQGVALAVALAGRTDSDADTIVREFWAQVATVEDAALQVTTKAAADKQELALRHGYEHALSEVAVAEGRQRLHQAREQAGDNDAGA